MPNPNHFKQILCAGISSMKTTKICLNNKWILKRAESNKHRIMIFAIFFSASFSFFFVALQMTGTLISEKGNLFENRIQQNWHNKWKMTLSATTIEVKWNVAWNEFINIFSMRNLGTCSLLSQIVWQNAFKFMIQMLNFKLIIIKYKTKSE